MVSLIFLLQKCHDQNVYFWLYHMELNWALPLLLRLRRDQWPLGIASSQNQLVPSAWLHIQVYKHWFTKGILGQIRASFSFFPNHVHCTIKTFVDFSSAIYTLNDYNLRGPSGHSTLVQYRSCPQIVEGLRPEYTPGHIRSSSPWSKSWLLSNTRIPSIHPFKCLDKNERRNSGGTLRQKFNFIGIWHLIFDI